ncbi:4Fe-4S binding protein [Propioniciclava coleopterorum]|uniref:4Fe-4S binding protein n=1 Tax=Propioniciclava coleopterorum TaxID=2714937 RepID=A0A6G7Y4C9_9ACTN|nr:4Fe-4S binding protein [Propioniciclava coleopterorum]
MTHRSIALIADRCTSCMICARECPTWCISLASHSEPLPDSPPGPRQRTRLVLDAFAIDWSLCLYCGICIEECPFDALEWRDAPPPASTSVAAMAPDLMPDAAQRTPAG